MKYPEREKINHVVYDLYIIYIEDALKYWNNVKMEIISWYNGWQINVNAIHVLPYRHLFPIFTTSGNMFSINSKGYLLNVSLSGIIWWLRFFQQLQYLLETIILWLPRHFGLKSHGWICAVHSCASVNKLFPFRTYTEINDSMTPKWWMQVLGKQKTKM